MSYEPKSRLIPTNGITLHAQVAGNGPLLLLASEAGSFMTGTIINVDGGHVNNSL